MDLVVCRDFLGLKINSDMIKNIIVPLEGFELLIKVVDLIGFFDETIDVIVQNMPKDYDKSILSDELLDKITKRTDILNKNMSKTESTIQFIVNSSKSQYIRLEIYHKDEYIHEILEFMCKYGVWDCKDKFLLTVKPIDYKCTAKYFDVSFIIKFFTIYLEAKKVNLTN